VVKNFGIGIYYRKVLDAIMDPTGTQMTTSYYDDVALVLGYNFRFWGGRIKVGVTGKAISRIEIANQALNPAGALDLSSVASEGTGVGADVGINIAAPWTWLPTISAVVRDVGSTQFTAGKGLRMSTTNIPATVPQDIDVAFALFPIHTNRTRSSFTLEYQKMTEAAQSGDVTRYYHVGYELNVHDILFLRAGMNQRYWTGGLEIASENFQFQLASYGEDVGAIGTPTEDRRFLIKLGYRF
jgi:hypothetical protein